MSTKREDQASATGLFAAVALEQAFLDRVLIAADEASERVMRRVAETGLRLPDKAQGDYFEAHHTETFNLDAVLNRMRGVEAHQPRSNGLKSADVVVTDRGVVQKEYGAKSYSTTSDNANAQKGYGDQSRLVPEGMAGPAAEYAARTIARDEAGGRPNRLENAVRLREVKDNLTERVEHDRHGGLQKAESEPLSRGEAERRLRAARRGEAPTFEPQYDLRVTVQESLHAGAVAAGVTIATAVGPRVAGEIAHMMRQGALRDDALARIADGVLPTAVESGLRAGAATAITFSAKAGLFGDAARSMSPPVVGALVYLTFEGIKDFQRVQRGDLSADWFADGMLRKSASATAGLYGAAVGQVLIPVPIVGAMLGSAVGGLLAQSGYQAVEAAADAHFRPAELEEVAQVFVLLGREWGRFTTEYTSWQATRAWYQDEWAASAARRSVIDRERHALDLDIQRALESYD